MPTIREGLAIMKIEYRPIGVIHSPFTELKGMPHQPASSMGARGTVEIYLEYESGLRDLDGFSHILLLCHLHQSKAYDLQPIPGRESVPRGLFSTRSPRRPNPIGVSVVRLVYIEGAILYIEDLDILDGTPLLDIKPYISPLQNESIVRLGWLEALRE